MQSDKKAAGLKEKAIEEFKVFWIIAVFLGLMFGAFTGYRGLILSEFGVGYIHYGAGLIEALIVAKVILIGQALGLGKQFEDGPLIFAALFKAVLYGAFVALFAVVEHLIHGLIRGQDLPAIWQSFIGLGKDEILARTLMVVVTFIPFFSFWETNRALGPGRLFALFFQRREQPGQS
jgi:hypothetical protein